MPAGQCLQSQKRNNRGGLQCKVRTPGPVSYTHLIDFLVGVAYANGGSLKPVANMTYIITPYNVGFIGEDLVGELENNGVII